MFNKIKTMAVNAANKVKTAFSAKQTELTAKAHAVLDGTVAESYIVWIVTGMKFIRFQCRFFHLKKAISLNFV